MTIVGDVLEPGEDAENGARRAPATPSQRICTIFQTAGGAQHESERFVFLFRGKGRNPEKHHQAHHWLVFCEKEEVLGVSELGVVISWKNGEDTIAALYRRFSKWMRRTLDARHRRWPCQF